MYQLGELLKAQPAMELVVLKEVERLLYRQNITVKAQYYGILFLSQVCKINPSCKFAHAFSFFFSRFCSITMSLTLPTA